MLLTFVQLRTYFIKLLIKLYTTDTLLTLQLPFKFRSIKLEFIIENSVFPLHFSFFTIFSETATLTSPHHLIVLNLGHDTLLEKLIEMFSSFGHLAACNKSM